MRTRNNLLDILRAICIIAVILGHTQFFDNIYFLKIIYSFHVALFFIISGYLTKTDKPLIDIIKTKFKSLIIPYLITSIIVLFGRILIKKEIFIYLCSIFYGSGEIEVEIRNLIFKSIGPVWFLPALFFATIFTKLLSKLNINKQFIISLILAIISTISSAYYWLPFSLQPALIGTFFMVTGKMCKEEKIKNIINNKIILLISLIISICYIYFIDSPDICAAKLPYLVVSIIGMLASCIVVYNLSKLLLRIKFLNKFLCFIGSNTLFILCIHTVQKTFLPTNSLIFFVLNIIFILIFLKLKKTKKI